MHHLFSKVFHQTHDDGWRGPKRLAQFLDMSVVKMTTYSKMTTNLVMPNWVSEIWFRFGSVVQKNASKRQNAKRSLACEKQIT